MPADRNGKVPYSGSTQSSYGPSGDNTPMLAVQVDVDELLDLSKQSNSPVEYGTSFLNPEWYFRPQSAYDEDVADFWDAVKDCMTEASLEALEDTGMGESFVCYLLKRNAIDSSGYNVHMDGILTVSTEDETDVYVCELYDEKGTYIGGLVTDSTNDDPAKDPTLRNVYDVYEAHLGRPSDIEWSGATATYTGDDNNRYRVTVYQSNGDSAGYTPMESSQISYEKKASHYYIALFGMTVEVLPCTVTWVDEDGTVLEIDTNVPHGTIPTYQGAIPTKAPDAQYTYTFAGWEPAVVEVAGDATYTATYTEELRAYTVTWKNDNGTVLETDTDVPYGTMPEYNGAVPGKAPTAQHTYVHAGWTPDVSEVTGDATYTAVYTTEQRNYDVTLQMLLDDERTDIEAIHEGVEDLYISADEGSTVYPAAWVDTGEYVAANVPNGTYRIYVEDGRGYRKLCDQVIVLKDADAEAACYYYTVTYDGNGAESGLPANGIHHLNTSVQVAHGEPRRSGHTFIGWQVDGTDTVLQPGQSLTGAIYKAHTLTALWKETVHVTVNVTINHEGGDGYDQMETRDEVFLALVSRADSSSAYLETGDTLALDGEEHDGFAYSESDNVTAYIAEAPTFTEMPGGTAEYTVVTSKSGYDTAVEAKQDEEGNWIIDVVMTYNPTNFDLAFTVEVDASVPEDYLPDAAIVKVTFWSTDRDRWEIITQQEGGGPGVRVDIDPDTRSGAGSYPVWKYESASNTPYGYRIRITSFVYPDGTILPASETVQEDAQWTDGVYTAAVEAVTGGQSYGALDGAYFDDAAEGQAGMLSAVIDMELYEVTFDARGGEVNGLDIQTVEEQYQIPAFRDYVPVREGGYTFSGWYEDPECTVPAAEGEDLSEDITLYAKWKAPLTVSGKIEIAGVYEWEGEQKTIQTADRIQEVTVMLQYAPAGSSTFSDRQTTTAAITYSGDIGTGAYGFANVPADDGIWRVCVLGRNYAAEYKNEISGGYGSENGTIASPNIARDADENDIAEIDIRMAFAPQNFDLRYLVDASAIGAGFRPVSAEVLVLYNDETDPGRAPQEWPVISQMQTGGTAPDFTYTGETVPVGAEDSYSVWTHHPKGHLYDYAIRLQSVDGAELTGAEHYTVSYNGSAAYKTSGGQQSQTRLLTATLTPRSYAIAYDLGLGGFWPAGTDHATEHTWSKDTDIIGIPERKGYTFVGWTADGEGVYADGRIAAATSQPVKLTANWSVNCYTVTWENEDGTVLETDTDVPYGTMPAYNGATPAKAPDAQRTYTFAGWTPTVSAVEGDVTYTAVYTESARLYTVTWKDYNGSVLKTQQVAYGEMPHYGEDPYRVPDSQFVYTFAGWTPEIQAVTEDAAYTATYDSADRLYTGCAKIYLDGSLTDAETVLGAGAQLYFSGDSDTYYELTGDDGVYGNYGMPNGNYRLYSKQGSGDYAEIGSQTLAISGGAAEIAVHYYSVTYDPDGGSGGPEDPEYHCAGSAVSAAVDEPVRSGYTFIGWQLDDTDTVLQPGQSLTGAIYKAHTLTALWEETVHVTVNVTVNHEGGDGYDQMETRDEVFLALVSRADSGSAYLETGDTLALDGEDHDGFAYSESDNVTAYIAEAPTFTEMPGGTAEYTVVTSKSGYDTAVEAKQDEDGNWIIDVVMTYNPTNFDLAFTVKVDASVPEDYLPDAASVKVTFWSTDRDRWEIITQQEGGGPGVRVDIDPDTRSGAGSYPVWKYESASNTPYGYRIRITSFVYPDGTIVPASETVQQDVQWTDGVYTAAVEAVTGGQSYGALDGAYFDDASEEQAGTLSAVIDMELYEVTFDARGGEVNGLDIQTVEEQYQIPAFRDYVPVREGGYTFSGWYEDPDCTDPASEGEDLSEDITLYAKWKAPLTVSGDIAVAGSYNNGSNNIHEADRPTAVLVTLYRKAPGADYAEVFGVPVSATITNDGDPGVGTYRFDGLPNDGSAYYVEATARNFAAKYWNEDLDPGSYSDYAQDQNRAADNNGDDIATVHAYLVFDPQNFELNYSIDASAIGSAFRPTEVETLIQYDSDSAAGYTWDTISQQMTDGVEMGLESTFDAAGFSAANYDVWQYHPLGHAYNYRILLQRVAYRPDGAAVSMETDFTDAPFTVAYTYPAFYDASADGQNILLTATLTPKTYAIDYELGTGGAWPGGTHPATGHTWSRETRINVTPVRGGYVFNGWTADAEGVFADGRITAATRQPVKLTANWIKIQDISFAGESGTVVYDGEEHCLSQITVSGLPEGYRYEGLTYAARGTDAGSYAGRFTGSVTVKDSTGKDVTEQFRAALIPGTLVIKADANGDGKPDDRQKKVTFVVVNGTWGGAGTEKVAYVDLDASGMGTLTLPVDMQPNVGYANGAWEGGTPGAAVSGTEEVTYTFRYELVSGLRYTVNYLETDSNRVLAAAKTQDGKVYGDIVTAETEIIAITGYRFDSASASELTIGTGENTLTLYYKKDDSATKTLWYTVKHLLEGVEQTAHTVTYEETVWVNDPDELSVVAGSLDAKKISGYRHVTTENAPVGDVIGSGTVVLLHYEKKGTPSKPPVPPVVPGTGSVILTKVDSADGNTTLAGVVFDLYKADGTFEGTYTTGAGGDITVDDLSAGGYYWIEIRPAEGYLLDTAKHGFTVSGGRNTEVRISNTRTPVPNVFSSDHYAYIIGYNDGLVHPEANITRAEVATIFFRLLNDTTRRQYLTGENNFSDVKPEMWFHTAVSTMAAMGIVNGYPDGNFHPNANITRAEFAAIAARFDAGGNTTGASFRDIHGHWAQKEILLAYNNGWILGYEDGTFRPNRNISRAEAMTLVNRVLQRVPEHRNDLLDGMTVWLDNKDTAKWYYLAVQEATNSHEYGRKQNGYEYWLALKENRDWAALEQ